MTLDASGGGGRLAIGEKRKVLRFVLFLSSLTALKEAHLPSRADRGLNGSVFCCQSWRCGRMAGARGNSGRSVCGISDMALRARDHELFL
jgi:hypothetical protein